MAQLGLPTFRNSQLENQEALTGVYRRLALARIGARQAQSIVNRGFLAKILPDSHAASM
jgi:hypothetical protein